MRQLIGNGTMEDHFRFEFWRVQGELEIAQDDLQIVRSELEILKKRIVVEVEKPKPKRRFLTTERT